MFKVFLEWMFPDSIYCMACHAVILPKSKYALCTRCYESLKLLDHKGCKKCGKALGVPYTDEYCFDCQSQGHHFRQGFSATEYGPVEKEIISGLKFKGKTYMAQGISQIMYNRLEDLGYGESYLFWHYLLPVPVHKGKLRSRGYNQSELIAQFLAKKTQIPLMKNGLKKSFDTEPLKTLSKRQRMEALEGAFSVEFPNEIKGKNILLIDDVYTTGSTVDHCAKTLMLHGAHSVDVFTFSIGKNYLFL